MKNHFTYLLIIFTFILCRVNIFGQEFPIAVGLDTTFSGGAVYGGANGIAAVQGDMTSQYSINAQLIGPGGTLVGSRISLGSNGVMPGAIPVFDATNYFLVWRDLGDSTVKGQFINTSGVLTGSTIIIGTDASLERNGTHTVALGDTTILVIYTKNNDYLYGRLVGISGNLLSSEIQISSNKARELSLAYDGTNFLVVWVEIIPDTDKDIYGQFVSKTGSLVGSNFVIDNGPNYSDNPTSLAFDGNRYLLTYHEMLPISEDLPWSIVGRFITTSGIIQDAITICDTTLHPFFPFVAFDGSNYFITWTQFSNSSMMGRFYNTSGVPIDAPFVVFGPLDNKIPVGGVGFGGGLYLVVATRVDSNFTDGDVYGRFIQPLTGIEEENYSFLNKYKLFQNYPNPFNPSTTIEYTIPTQSYVNLKIFDVLGREVATLVDQLETAGRKSINFNAKGLSSGIYYYQLVTGNYRETKKFILMK